MPSNYEKLSRPTGPTPDIITAPRKAALPNVSTAFPSDEKTPRVSTVSSPHSDKSGDPFDTDLEAMVPINAKSNSCLHKTQTRTRKSDCQVWPGRDQWKQNAKLAKRNRAWGCACLSRLSSRNRIIAKILIALLIVGIAVGVGFGISKPLGAPIWGDRNHRQ